VNVLDRTSVEYLPEVCAEKNTTLKMEQPKHLFLILKCNEAKRGIRLLRSNAEFLSMRLRCDQNAEFVPSHHLNGNHKHMHLSKNPFQSTHLLQTFLPPHLVQLSIGTHHSLARSHVALSEQSLLLRAEGAND
jgi:hypothetical protein